MGEAPPMQGVPFFSALTPKGGAKDATQISLCEEENLPNNERSTWLQLVQPSVRSSIHSSPSGAAP